MARTEIVAEASLETTKFQRGLAKAENGIKKFTRNAMSSFGALAGAAGIASAVKSLSSYVTEMENAAKIAGEGSEDFQRFAFATKSVGIEQEKAADILKDVKDKVGDFLATGAGPMADFFEKIAPQVGVTAEQFRKLSGREALQLYVSSLEKANVSSNEMTFYLEAIASDASALLPLLQNGGAELDNLANKADRVGAVIESKTAQQIKALNEGLSQAGMVALAATAKVVDFGQGVFEAMFAAADSVIRGTNTFEELRDAEIEAEQATYDLNRAQEMQMATAEAATRVNNMLTEAFEGQKITIDELMKAEAKWAADDAKWQADRISNAEKAAKAKEDQFIAEKELMMLRLRAEGKHDEADKLQEQIDKMKEAIKLRRQYNITLEEAANLVKNGATEPREEEKPDTTPEDQMGIYQQAIANGWRPGEETKPEEQFSLSGFGAIGGKGGKYGGFTEGQLRDIVGGGSALKRAMAFAQAGRDPITGSINRLNAGEQARSSRSQPKTHTDMMQDKMARSLELIEREMTRQPTT